MCIILFLIFIFFVSFLLKIIISFWLNPVFAFIFLLASFLKVITESSFVKIPVLKKTNSADNLTDVSSNTETTESNHSEVEKEMDQKDEADKSNVLLCEEIEFDNEPKEIYLPASASSLKVPNCCAICLCSYDINDTVIWSCNKDCGHAFHDECIIPWLVKNQSGECPCCRRQFTDLPPPGEDKNKNNSRPSVWSIRSWFLRLRYTFLSTRNETATNETTSDANIV